MDGVPNSALTDIWMIDGNLGKGARSVDESEQSQRSKKKTKIGEADQENVSVDMVVETPLDTGFKEREACQEERLELNSSFQTSYRDMVRSRDPSPASPIRTSAGFYDDGNVSNDDEINPEEDDPLCPTIRLTKAEKVRFRSPWRKTLIIKVMGKAVG